MTQILRPSRIEYVQWAVNWRRGCSHGCRYCYAAALARRFNPEEKIDWSSPELVVPDPAAALRRQLAHKRKPVGGMILVSSSHDPFMPGSEEGRGIVTVLGYFELWPQTLLLTKAPTAALQALDGLGAGPKGLWFGASITSMSLPISTRFEPQAERPLDRLQALEEAKRSGYRTWASVEPALPGARLDHLVGVAWNAGVDWVVVGKMNHRGTPASSRDGSVLGEWSRADHWPRDRDAAAALLRAVGYQESLQPSTRGYWVKRELAGV